MILFSTIRVAIRAALFIAAALYFAWIFDQQIPFAGIKKITYTFSELSGPVSEPYPRDRTQRVGIARDGSVPVRMVEDPLYFDVRSRVDYESAEISLYFRNESNKQARLGMRVFGDTWQTVIPPGQTIEAAASAWDAIHARFDLRSIARRQNKYTFLISAPGLRYQNDNGESLLLSHADIRLIRKPLFGK
ncbi:hypothetical protein HYV71_00925 [Candidatus Uhrbacteria bacterium]|nr:hypothetical protein [Candidatus Uhrbacteria bacterium]